MRSSYGWQQVNFASPVSIQANTVYIVSFSTGGGYFGISTGFFTNGGVTSGPLQALSNHTSGGDGVYQAAGDFPNVNGSGMNFWVDVAFAPSASPGVQTSSASPGVGTARQWGVSAATTAAATPAGTSSSTGGSRATTVPAAQPASIAMASRTFRRTVTQARPAIWWGLKGPSTIG